MKHSLNLNVWSIGLVTYEQSLAWQRQIHAAVASSRAQPSLLALQHHPVITLGRNADEALLLTKPSKLSKLGLALAHSDRGGQITAHMPGQLVFYPILPLRALGLSVRSYVHLLEEACLRTVAQWGITAKRERDYPGLWVGKQKLAALGVRVKQHTSMHGLSLNVNGDLSLFKHIIPCGIQGRGVANMQGLSPDPLGLAPGDLEKVAEVFAHEFASLLGFGMLKWQRQEAFNQYLTNLSSTCVLNTELREPMMAPGHTSSEAKY